LKYRQEIFKANLEYIQAKNREEGITYTLGVNKFADMSNEEFRKRLGRKKNDAFRAQSKQDFKILDDSNLPDSIDWRAKGGVNYVQDQGDCGSCWAFSAIAAIEGAHFVKTGQLVKLSEQQIVDCAGWNYGNFGCNGGDETSAMRYSMNSTIESEDIYPYEAESDIFCTAIDYLGLVKLQEVNVVPPNNANQLLAAIAQVPTTVAVEADTDFQFYTSGILNKTSCGDNLDHAIAAVGYNRTGGYYIVRNSWGVNWGEAGYIRIAITEGEGICGIQKDCSWAVATN
jgi:C1A family cysteine protease